MAERWEDSSWLDFLCVEAGRIASEANGSQVTPAEWIYLYYEVKEEIPESRKPSLARYAKRVIEKHPNLSYESIAL